MLSKTTVHDYENMFSLEVLAVQDKHIRDNETVYNELELEKQL